MDDVGINMRIVATATARSPDYLSTHATGIGIADTGSKIVFAILDGEAVTSAFLDERGFDLLCGLIADVVQARNLAAAPTLASKQ